MRVTAFTKYDREAASTRQRFLKYAPYLADAGIELRHRPLLDDAYVRSLATGEHWSRAALLRSYLDRLIELIRRPRGDLIWIHSELFPYLPSSFDRLVFRSGIPVVYDWDDAHFVRYNGSRNGLVRSLLSGKIERLIAGASAATCGNHFLRDYAARYCPISEIFPTVVDIESYRPSVRSGDELVIGWIGSPTTWESVRTILPVLHDICERFNVRFRVVGAGIKAEGDRFARMELVPWAEQTEVAEVQGFDIGIMPLIDGPFERGKSAYKLVQYMACGIPAVASPVGANLSVLNSECGIFATTGEEWTAALTALLGNPELRRRLGENGRERAVAHYSLQVHAPRLIKLFREVAAPIVEKASI